MTISKNRLKAISKKLAGRTKQSSNQKFIDRFNELHEQGLIHTKDGKIVTHAEWVELQDEPLRSQLKNLVGSPEN